MEGRVEGVEGHYCEPHQKACLEKGEDNAEQPVQPAQHHKLEDALQNLAQSCKYEEHDDEYQGEGHNFQHLLRSGDVLTDPNAHGGGESGRSPDADYDGDYGNRL